LPTTIIKKKNCSSCA